MRVWPLVLLALLAAAPVHAQQRSPLAGDARLDKKVTVAWKKATLREALDELSRATGARLVPERGLVDEPVMASAREIPARALLEQLATLLHFTWTRTGGTPEAPAYLLFQDRAARQEEEDEITGGRRAVQQAIQQELDKYRRLSRLPAERLQQDIEKSDEELTQSLAGGLVNPISSPGMERRFMDGQAMRAVASPIGKSMLQVVDGLSPGQWSALLNNQPLVFSSQPEEGQLPLPPGLSDRLREARPGFPFPKALFRSLGPQVEEGVTRLEGVMGEQWGRGNGFRVTLQLSLNLGAQPLGMLRVSPEPLGTETIGPLFAATGLTVIGAPSLYQEPEEDPAEREKRLAGDPVLGKKAILKLPPAETPAGLMAMFGGNARRTADLLSPIEAAFGVKLVGDAYNRQALATVPAPGEAPVPLYKILDTLCGQSRRWERDGDLIRLKSRTWAHDRRAEIPARYMRRWLEVRGRKGGFALDDLAEIAGMLRDEQVESLMFSAMEAGVKDLSDFVSIPMNRDILRFYGKLLPLQRKALQAGRPQPVLDLYPFQQALLLSLNRNSNQSMFALALGTKPQRSPAQLAGAGLSLEIRQIPVEAAAAAADASKKAGLPQGFSAPASICTFRFSFPNGQKDEYQVQLVRPAADGAAAAPPAPAPLNPPSPR